MTVVDVLPLALVLVALVLVAVAFVRDYVRGPRRPIATDHDHAHHGLIWALLLLMLLGVCGPAARQGPPGPPGPPGPSGAPGPSGRPAATP